MENVIITGATKGMGRAIAIAFAKQGTNLAICSRNNEELLILKEQLIKINPEIKIVSRQTDCSIKDEVLTFAGLAEQELGFISVIINNVGVYEPLSILDEDEFAFQRMLDINLMPSYQLYRYFGKTMMASGRGHIFTICSVAAINPVAEAGMYSVTKFALLGLSKVMRLEMQDYGVKVTTLLPGSTLTESWKDTGLSPDRFVSPDDVASSIIAAWKMSKGANIDEIVIKPVWGQV
ncbi:SDR family oxidoreductase [Mucilaginibacter paludis]|uniref:Short-chain dehydrogenase/reductase SDR n=1 Tax=Mucilaginibacter paludis DSM 18603 TaxID=714943 RepID=H1YF38_9SPHI|nr:SDR family oxidoreductase [Mucilaginibacter paludis]EHQ25291.1 short-chain dehydrogenase/reductase SDR [Mucilaginibacter paludis DSM 18603]